MDITDEIIAYESGLMDDIKTYKKGLMSESEIIAFFQNLVDTGLILKLKDDYRGWKFALITPDKDLEKRCALSALSYPLYHGGLKLRLLTGTIQA